MRILGISPLHDSSVAVINNGKLERFYKEERLSRIKRDGPPILALQKIFEEYKDITIDHACISAPSAGDPSVAYIVTQLKKILKCPVTDYSDYHHICHANLAFNNSYFNEALVFVIDRNGSIVNDVMREAETVFRASVDYGITTIHKNFWVNDKGSQADQFRLETLRQLNSQNFSYNAESTMSIVKVYESATTLIGEKPLENGKTMGLASYGKDQFAENFFINGRPNDNLFVHGNFIFDNLPTTLYKNFLDCRTDRVTEENHIFYADYAFQVQKQTQEVVLQFVKEWVEKTGINKVCMSGGYALNVVANNYLILNLPEVEFYFEPLADDSGNSIGCALSLYKYLTKNEEKFPIADTFYHGTDPDLSTIVGETCTTEDVALALKNFKTVAVFTGKAEAGPRALGNRSILYNPQDPDSKAKVNLIKRREWYRPFAAMVLEENFSEYFETVGLTKSESMTVSFNTKLPQDIPGVVHVDNSCRVQTVSDNLPHMHNLLIEFKKQTGIPVLLNTSFNLAGEALVETVDDAIKTFEETHLDILWFPSINKWIKK